MVDTKFSESVETLPVIFKTGGRRVTPSPVRSTRTLFAVLASCYHEAI
jgi:hypothetical protein